jgi:hypothetical protein
MSVDRKLHGPYALLPLGLACGRFAGVSCAQLCFVVLSCNGRTLASC